MNQHTPIADITDEEIEKLNFEAPKPGEEAELLADLYKIGTEPVARDPHEVHSGSPVSSAVLAIAGPSTGMGCGRN